VSADEKRSDKGFLLLTMGEDEMIKMLMGGSVCLLLCAYLLHIACCFFPVVVLKNINWGNLMKILGCDMLSFFFFMFGIGGIRAFFDELKYMKK